MEKTEPKKFTKGGFIVLLVFLAIVFAFTYEYQKGKEAVANMKWYQGGTLQNVTVLEWQKADERNQLATCAGWIATFEQQRNIQATSLMEYQNKATLLETGINTYINGYTDKELDTVKIATVANIAYYIIAGTKKQ